MRSSVKLGSRNPNNLETTGRWKIQAMAEVDIIKVNIIKVVIIKEDIIKLDIIKEDMELEVVVGST